MKVIKAPKTTGGSVPRGRRVLVVGGDTQVGLWVVRSLGRAGLKVFCTCRHPRGLAAFSRYTSGAWVIEGSVWSGGFIDQLERLAREQAVGSIMTIAENYHQALIGARSRFEPEIKVFSPTAECFAKATDKDYLYGLCAQLGIPVAKGTTLDRLMADPAAAGLKYPLVLRSARQNDPDRPAACPWKAAYARNEVELSKLHERVKALAAYVLVQEYQSGAEDHMQILMHCGEPFMVGEYIGEHHMPLAGGVTVQRVTCRHEPLIADAVRLLKAIGWEGLTGVQFHHDPTSGRYIFLEINPRFIGGLPTVIMAGFDAPLLLWQSHFAPQSMRRTPYRLGVRTRVFGGDARWLFSMLRGDELPPGQRRLGKVRAIAEFLFNSAPWTRDDVFSLADPLPAWVDLRAMLGRFGEESIDIIGRGEERP